MMHTYLYIALGGALGAVLRYAFSQLPLAFPYATLLINVAGCALMGAVMAKFTAGNISEPARLFLAVGVLGGFTTFSAFSFDFLQLALRGAWAQAVFYAAASVVLSLLAVWVGYSVFVIKS
jgi:fluoride exporter